jgi:hypothetical protein
MQQLATIEVDSLTPKQQRAIFALLSEPTLEDAARQAGIQRSTLWRWLQDSAFRSFYMQARRLAVQRAIARTQAVTCEAVETLREVMNNPASRGSERVAAAKAIIDYAFKGIELEDLAQRLEAVEMVLAKGGRR